MTNDSADAPTESVIIVTRRLRLTQRSCQAPGCSKEFLGTGRQKYCSRTCAVRADYHNHLESRRTRQRERYRRSRQKEG